MRKPVFFLLCGSAAVLGSIQACSYELPTTGDPDTSSSGTSSTVSSGEGGKGGQGQGGMNNEGGKGGAGGNASSPTIACGTTECTDGKICCQNQTGYRECVFNYQCDTTFTIVNCDGPEDCSVGYICCGVWDGMKYSSVYCGVVCNYPSVAICHFGQPEPGCPNKTFCNEEPKLGPGYGWCTQ